MTAWPVVSEATISVRFPTAAPDREGHTRAFFRVQPEPTQLEKHEKLGIGWLGSAGDIHADID